MARQAFKALSTLLITGEAYVRSALSAMAVILGPEESSFRRLMAFELSDSGMGEKNLEVSSSA